MAGLSVFVCSGDLADTDLLAGMTTSLAGFSIGITGERGGAVLASAFAKLGAHVVRGPAIRVVEPAGDEVLQAATAQCLAVYPDVVVVTTARGLAGWRAAAQADGVGAALDAMLAAAAVVRRDPPSWAAVMAYLLAYDLVDGKRVAVQSHGEPAHGLLAALRSRGAEVIEVPVYRWVPPDDELPLHRLIEATGSGALDAVTFTNASAAVNFLRTADQLGLLADVSAALSSSVLCACVGPVTAAPLRAAGIGVAMPARPRLAALAREIVEQLPRRAPVLQAAGHLLELRGSAIVVDGALVPLPSGSMALLRELARRPGQVLSRDTLAGLLPGGRSEAHAVEAAIGRLRSALGDPAIVQTVVKRGYRLSVDAHPTTSRVAALR